LHRGWADGQTRALAPLPPLPRAAPPFLPFRPQTPDRGARVLAGRPWQARRLRRQAADLSAQGWRISLFLFSPSARYHHVRFDPAGFWEQAGGLFGRSDRQGPVFRPWQFGARLQSEVARIAPQLKMDDKWMHG